MRRTPIVVCALVLGLALGTTPAWAAPSEGEEQPTSSAPTGQEENPLEEVLDLMNEVREMLLIRDLDQARQAQERLADLLDRDRPDDDSSSSSSDESGSESEDETVLDPAVEGQGEVMRELEELIHAAEHQAGQ